MEEKYDKIKYDSKTNIFINQNANYQFQEIRDELFARLEFLQGSQFHTQRRHRKVIKTELQDEEVYIKSYSPTHTDNFGDKLKNITLFKSTALKEFEILLRLEELQLPVVKPLIVVEREVIPLVKESIIVTLGCPGIEAREVIASEEYDFDFKRKIMEQACDYLFRLHSFDIVDSDYKFRNLLFVELEAEQFKLVLIDKERAKINCQSKLLKIKGWGKFIANWINMLVNSSSLNNKLAKDELNYYRNKVINNLSVNFLEEKLLNYSIHRKLKVEGIVV
ncbi:lipopolysaccharide kinase InaA family protein [Natroniella sulfidigena]|uniref:lipopolysaccharide kinase InaA family protein n=1 Tax=Natroniella sulfidigena TaxID=723921 RepID=UPI00200B6CD6|nr:lipopolysaccharide kinase InaA family protein [Natroniella sulfidigena]MCK8816317.1 lipopolysaccharide kinase InaA family protein [Natroniella sulfidigena]